MELKRILARDARSATDQAVKLYGEDVLIVSNTRVGQQTELVVAVDIAREAQAQTSAPATEHKGAFQQQFDALMGRASAPAASTTSIAVPDSIDQVNDRDRIRSQEIVALVREELADLRREFRLGQRSAMWQQHSGWSDEVQPLVARLREATMPGALRHLLLDSLHGLEDAQEAVRVLREQLISAAGTSASAMPEPGVHVLAGPSGAGKSTFAARLAKWGVEQFGSDQVALISYADMRAGAWSQTQMLGALAGAQTWRALDSSMLALLLSEIGHRRLVIIDTPGVQMQQHVQEILKECPQARLHAVIAADASEATCRRVLQNSGLVFAGLMLSKLDEADAPWPLLQFLSNEPQIPARSLVSASDGFSQPLQTWTVQQIVDHAMQVSGLKTQGADKPHLTTAQIAGSFRELNG